MMVKVFTLNKNNKIEFTKEELQTLLNQSFWEGYYKNNYTYTYASPWISPITTVTNKTITPGTATATNKTITSGTITGNDIQIKYNNE